MKRHLVQVPPKQDGQTDEQYQEVIQETIEFKHKVASPHCRQLTVTELEIIGPDID